MELSEYISDAIVKRRAELGMSRYELERQTGISYNQLMNMENTGKTSLRLLDRVLKALKLKIVVKELPN